MAMFTSPDAMVHSAPANERSDYVTSGFNGNVPLRDRRVCLRTTTGNGREV